ncbi:MAG: hypothetical protein CVT83_06465, partial [Alphaproteobacteria bacterium HGW-Alphaproteobacteria-5]
MSVSRPARFLSLSPMGWWRPGAALGLDLVHDRYMLGGIPRARPALLSFSRAFDALFDNTAGVYSVFGANVPAITDRGLYPGGQRTNLVPNNTYQGASA